MEKQTLQNTPDQNQFQTHFGVTNPQEANEQIADLADRYSYYMNNLHRKFIVLTDPGEKRVSLKSSSDSSRYTSTGLQRIKEKIRHRLRAYPSTFGVLLTLTIAEFEANAKYYSGRTQLEAWESINKCGREFTDELNKWRKRHGLKTIRAYVKVLEIQPNRYYPHLHIYFPGLRWLAPVQTIQRLWPYGNADLDFRDSLSPGNYITKYLSKMEARDFLNVMLYSFKLRMFSNSRALRYAPEVKGKTSWRCSTSGSRSYVFDVIQQYLKAGYSLTPNNCAEPRGP